MQELPENSYTISEDKLEHFLRRTRKKIVLETISFSEILQHTLYSAVNTISCNDVAILLDDPFSKSTSSTKLTYVAVCGDKLRHFLGKIINIYDKEERNDIYNNGRLLTYNVNLITDESIVNKNSELKCLGAPIHIEKSVCGIFEAYNHNKNYNFTDNDRKFLNILTGYLSLALQNTVDNFKIRKIAITDSLTGLYNMYYLQQRLNELVISARNNKKNITVLFIDLDNFKLVNDQYGHVSGSNLLHFVGKAIYNEMEGNGECFRFGGDEFMVISDRLNVEDMLKAACNIQEKIRKLSSEIDLFIDSDALKYDSNIKRNIILTCSAGIASLEKNISNNIPVYNQVQELIKSSDNAMYKAKQNGKDRVEIYE